MRTQTRRIGSTAIEVTELGFGSSPIGNLFKPVDEDVARASVETAWKSGIRYFDTAPHYGLGLAERRLGSVLAQHRRDEYVLSTKVGRVLVENPTPSGDDLKEGFAVADTLMRVRDYSRDGVLRCLQGSLERLGTDRVDIVFVHDPEDHMEAALGEAVPALLELRDQGVLGAVGAGMTQVQPLLRFAREADVDVLLMAGRWTLMDRTGAAVLDACSERGISIIAGGPFNSGLLAQPYPVDGAHFDYRPASAAELAAARELAHTCREHGTTLPHAALQFALRSQAVASVVAGMRTPEHVNANVEMIRTPIEDGLWRAVSPREV